MFGSLSRDLGRADGTKCHVRHRTSARSLPAHARRSRRRPARAAAFIDSSFSTKAEYEASVKTAAGAPADDAAALQRRVKSLEANLRTCMKAANVGTPDFVAGSPHFAFLVLKEHPYGREMLEQLVAKGFKPAIVIEEDDGKIAAEERTKFEERIKGNKLAPTIEAQCAQHGIERADCPQHNLSGCLALLSRVKPRLVVLGGTRIIRDPILSFPLDGVVNAHPGLLPLCRGSASPAWSVFHEIPIGSTCHFCDRGIDTGHIIQKREVAVRRGSRLNCRRSSRWAERLL